MSYHSLFFSYQDQSPWTENGDANLTNPLIVAMTEMGISSTKIRELLNKLAKKNPAQKLPENESDLEIITRQNWEQHIGRKQSYSALVRFFQVLIEEEPENIRQYFSQLADGIYTNDFYSLIRLAYALESGQKEEVARALAFLTASYQPLHFELPEQETKVFIEQIMGLAEKKGNYSIEGTNLYDKICHISQNRAYLQDFAKLEEENLNIYTLRALAIRLGRETKEDVLKNLFCAVHAFRVISPLLPDFPAAIQQFYLVMQAAYLALGCPEMKPAEAGTEKNWPLIFQLSGVSKNSSHIFFIYSCYREYQFAQSSIYPEMAYQLIHSELKPEIVNQPKTVK